MTQPSHDPIEPVTLSPPDAAAMDALLEAGAPLKITSGQNADAQRTARLQAWLKILASAPAPQAPADLMERTLAAIQKDRMPLNPHGIPLPQGAAVTPPPRRFWTPHMGEIAAMLIAAALLVAVFIPSLSAARRSSARVACASNLKAVAAGFGNYALAYSGQLPIMAMPANHNWLHGDTETAARTNAAHLIPLVTGHYIAMENLYCPARKVETRAGTTPYNLPDIDYSYVNLYGPARPTWNGDSANIILADRNPLLTGDPPDTPDANSLNHEGRGEYLVRADGSVSWEVSPNVGPLGDNIWTLGAGNQRHIAFIGTEIPASPADVFLIP